MDFARRGSSSCNVDVHADLVKACESGDLNMLLMTSYNNQNIFQKLVKGDLNYPFKSKYGSYKPGDYLFIACENGHAEVAKHLLKSGAENRPYGKLTPLQITCKNGKLEVLKVLAEGCVSLFEEDLPFRDSAIFFSCRYGHRDLLEYIVQVIPDVLSKKANETLGETPGTKYVEIWSEMTRIIKREGGVLVGTLLLYVACLLEYKDIVEFLVKQGNVSVDGKLTKLSFNAVVECPLSIACKVMNLDIINFLLENKAVITESVSTQFPELIGKWLDKKVKPYQRSYSVSVVAKNQPMTYQSLVLYWDNLGIQNVSRHWLKIYDEKVAKIDIHDNKLTKLPIDFFELLPNLEDIDISCNMIEKLPELGLETSKVTRIIACYNSMVTVPLGLFMNENIVVLDLSRNKIRKLPVQGRKHSGTVCPNETFWKCKKLTTLKLSRNGIVEIPKEIQGAIGLGKLQLDENQLCSFDTVWNCPLTDLDLSKNQLQQFSGMTQTVWSKTLSRLNLSFNCLHAISRSVTQLASLQYLNLSHNNIKTLPPVGNWKCKTLLKLNLSHNEFTGKSVYHGYDTEMPFVSTCEFPVHLFEDTLEGLDLSNNHLEIFPESICGLKMLCELDLSRNPNLRHIPNQLGNLKNVWNLRLAELNIPELPHFTFEDKNMAKQVLPHLRAKLRKAVPFNRMKLMIVGLQGRGKTTLLAAIQGKGQLPDDISTVGITIEQFGLPIKTRLGGFLSGGTKPKVIQFSAWDLAGQQVYYATHQCFLTSQTLYLVVFDLRHGFEGIRTLSPWLANIQARAPDSRCIIVGTHMDRLPPNESRRTTLNSFEQLITSSYMKKGFPIISEIVFVSSTSGDNIEQLRQCIYNVADKMIETGGYSNPTGTSSSNVKMAPGSYVALYDSVILENARRKHINIPPILTTQEMLLLAEQNPENDIYADEELILASKFLHENGILLHFDDHLRELNNLFFIDPSWLVDMLALVVTIREKNPFINDGYIRRKELMMVLRDPRLPDNFVPQYLRLLERFEIALCLDEDIFLIPSMLPTERPNLNKHLEKYTEIESEVGDKGRRCLNRSYHMSYIPSGFWCRLIARLMIAVHKWGMQVSEYDGNSNISNFEKYQSILWREGLLVAYNDGFFLVESFLDDIEYDDWCNQGVAITVWSKDQDFSVMGFIVDHLDMLITEWYPGLEDVDNSGMNLIQKLISCPICCDKEKMRLKEEYSDFKPGDQYSDDFTHYFRNTEYVQQFNLLTCALAATSFQAIHCDKHPELHVGLDLVVPDLMLTDLPDHFMIDPQYFVFKPSIATRLGEGGAGGVYRGEYKGVKVAVKQFHSTTKAKQFDKSNSVTYSMDSTDSVSIFMPSEQSMQEQLEDGKVIRAFWELRQEVSILCRLEHPNIIKFLGVCHSPLCFVIELAPMGSLQGILEQKQQERDNTSEAVSENGIMHGSILGRYISCKIAFQVIDALYYLHDSEIVYRDLKSDNVLVWTLDEKEKVNVKLSDYGIAAFATPQGVVGEGGTPGFQAPEIKYNAPYDEKVDIFSFGIWLYELLSGHRPFREIRTGSEMKKAILRGVRPNLRADLINTELPLLEYLMDDCWQPSPSCRPSSEQVTLSLTHPDVCMLEHVFPRADAMMLQRVCVAIPWEEENQNTILLWSEHEADRKYQIVDLLNEKQTIEKHVPGARILCACQVENHVWLGNEVSCQIEVFGHFEDNHKPKVLWQFVLPSDVLSLLTYTKENLLTVFASLVDGHLCVFRKDTEASSSEQPIFNETYEDRISFEKDKWVLIKTLNLGTKFPAQCMSLTRNNTELWVGSGKYIAVVDPETISIKEHIETTVKNRHVYVMTSNLKNLVWHSERSMSFVIQWDVDTRTKMFEFHCNVENPLNHILLGNTGSRSDSVSTLPPMDEQDNSVDANENLDLEPETRSRTVSITKPLVDRRSSDIIIGSPTKRIPSLKPRSVSHDSAEFSIKETNEPVGELVKPDGFVSRSLQKKPSLMYPSTKNKRSFKKPQAPTEAPKNMNSPKKQRRGVVTDRPIRVTSLMYVKGAVWVGRNFGDVLVVSVEDDRVPVGKVVTVLGGLNVRPLGGINRTVTSLVNCSQDKALALVRHDLKSAPGKSPKIRQLSDSNYIAHVNYQILKYAMWSVDEIEDFKETNALQE